MSISQSLIQLDTLWSRYRLEKIHLPADQLKTKQIRKWVVHELVTEYVDQRRAGETRSVAFLFLPPRITLGSVMTTHLVAEYVTERHMEHLVLICTKESKTAATILRQSGLVYWEILSYEDIAFDKMECGMVPRYQVVLTAAERAEAVRLLGLEPSQWSQVPRMIHREDAIGRLLGFRQGDLVRGVRTEVMTLDSIFYRFVAPGT